MRLPHRSLLAASRPLASALLLAAPLLAATARAQAPAAQPTAAPAAADPQQLRFEQLLQSHTTVKVLPNGLTLVLSERHNAPVFSFYTLVDAGSADDPGGQSGLAHMFEHIAFKGTPEIGTTNWPAEKAALAQVEAANAAFEHEFRKPTPPAGVAVTAANAAEFQDPARLAKLQQAFQAAVEKAQTYVIPNEFSEIAESNGAVNLNASTGEDSTQYFWSMPSNRLELWAYLESSRLAQPVAREFYKERDVVQEERRMRVDSSPQGRLVEGFLAAAYVAHPYGRPGTGWSSEISQVTATEADAFHRKYYVPSNIVIAVVGDINPATALPLLERYFGRIPAGPRPEPMTTVEPPQHAERSVVLRETSQPFYLEGYHKPSYRSPDDAVYDAITDIFSNGRTSRLYRSLVRDQHIAAVAEGFSGFPGVKFPGLFAFYAVPMQGHTNEELRNAIHQQLDVLKTTDVTDAELERFKARARADLLRGLADNEGLATAFAEFQTRFGDWREMFHQLARIDAVTKADIRRVANTTFTEDNRTSARIDFVPPATSPAGAPSAPQAEAGKGGAE